MTSRSVITFGLLLGVFLSPIPQQAAAQDPRPLFNEIGEDADAEHARFLKIARLFELTAGEDGPLALRSEAIMNWSNPARNAEQGSIFLWEADGRPEVVGTVFTYASSDGAVRTKLAIHSLAGGPVNATLDGQPVWHPTQPGLDWHMAESSSTKAGSPSIRLVRMRAIGRQFDVRLTNLRKDPEKLRLLPQPLYRYQPQDSEVVDGAIFGFVTGTDPEALLIVEAVKSQDGVAWRYAFARFHFAEVVASREDAIVWKAELEYDQRLNRLGVPEFQDRTYSTMLIGEHLPDSPQE